MSVHTADMIARFAASGLVVFMVGCIALGLGYFFGATGAAVFLLGALWRAIYQFPTTNDDLEQR